MDLREIYAVRGLDGVLDALQPLVDQLEELNKPAVLPAVLPAEEAEEEKA